MMMLLTHRQGPLTVPRRTPVLDPGAVLHAIRELLARHARPAPEPDTSIDWEDGEIGEAFPAPIYHG